MPSSEECRHLAGIYGDSVRARHGDLEGKMQQLPGLHQGDLFFAVIAYGRDGTRRCLAMK